MSRRGWRKLANRISSGPADTEIREAMFDHVVRIVQVAAIDDDGVAKSLVEALEVERSELRPIREDEEGVGVFSGFVCVAGVAEIGSCGKNLLGTLHGGGVEGNDRTTLGEEHLDEFNCRRLADIVGFALEGEAEDAEPLAAKGPQSRTYLAEEPLLLLDVDLFDFCEEVEVDAQLLCYGAEGGYVLGEAGTAVTDAGTKEFWADACVEAHAARHLLDVGVGGFAEIGDGIDKGDFESEKGIGGMLDDLGALGGGEEDGRRCGDAADTGNGVGAAVILAAGEWSVDGVKDGGGAVVVGTDDDAVGVEEVGDGGSFAEELGIGDDVEEVTGDAVALHGTADPLVGVDGDGAFFDDDFVGGKGACDLAGNGFDVREIGVAGLALRGADGNEDGVALAGSFGKVSHEAHFGVAVALEEFGEVALVDEGVSALKGGNLALIIVDADDVMAHFSKTNGCYEPDVPRSNNGDLNSFIHKLGDRSPFQENTRV